MIYTFPLQKYVRADVPQNTQSQVLYLTEELKKLERTLATVTAALEQIGVHVP
jgi:hypothetical protein